MLSLTLWLSHSFSEALFPIHRMVPCRPPSLNMQSWIWTQKSWLPFFKQINLYLFVGVTWACQDICGCQMSEDNFQEWIFLLLPGGPWELNSGLTRLGSECRYPQSFSPTHYFLPLLHSPSHASYWGLQLAWPIAFSQTLPKLSASFLLSLFLSSLINKTRNPKGILNDSLITLALWAKCLAHSTQLMNSSNY